MRLVAEKKITVIVTLRSEVSVQATFDSHQPIGPPRARVKIFSQSVAKVMKVLVVVAK